MGADLTMSIPAGGSIFSASESQVVIRLDNGYGLSVINDGYGTDGGLYEYAVLKFDDAGVPRITYDTPLTSDVEGWQTLDDIRAALTQLAALRRPSAGGDS